MADAAPTYGPVTNETVAYVTYEPANGEIVGYGAMPRGGLSIPPIALPGFPIPTTERLEGEGRPETHYVDLAPGFPVLRERPEMKIALSRTEIAPREEATISGLPACALTFTGPLAGTHQHGGGDLAVGWTVPGTYELHFEAFPYQETSLTIIVKGPLS